MTLKKREVKTLTEKITGERDRILKTFSEEDHEKYFVKTEDRPDEVDQASTEYERAQMLRFRNRDLFYVKKLQKALDKIDSDDYGICEDCGATIKFERLLARPTAELCIACKDEAEREELGNFIGRQSKSLGKTVTLA